MSGLVCLLLGGGGLWFCATGEFEETLDSLPDYNYLEEILALEKEKRLGEAEHLADWVLEGDNVASRDEIQALRDRINKERTSFWKRAHRAGKGFLTGNGVSVEELGGAVVSDFLLWGDIRDLAKQGYYKVTGQETDAVVASLAAVGIATSLASYLPDPAEGAEVSVDASLSLLKTLKKTGNLSKKFCGVLVDGCKKSVKSKSFTKGMKEIIVGMKNLFDGVGSARMAIIMRHVDDADSLQAVAKMSKRTAEPTTLLVRMEGEKGIKALRHLANAEDGARVLEKAARKGPRGLEKILNYTKYGARTAKAFKLGHVQDFTLELARKVGRLPIALASGCLALCGLWKLRILKLARLRVTSKKIEE
jgi:hypothetical protein